MDPTAMCMCVRVWFCVCARAHDDYCTQREMTAVTKNNNLFCVRTHNYCRCRILCDRTLSIFLLRVAYKNRYFIFLL